MSGNFVVNMTWRYLFDNEAVIFWQHLGKTFQLNIVYPGGRLKNFFRMLSEIRNDNRAVNLLRKKKKKRKNMCKFGNYLQKPLN